MLAEGIIRETMLPFSSPVLLVKKQDEMHGLLSFERQDDQEQVPIPVVDELLDELQGARFFTKLDLRSGYHQVRMYPEDVV